MKRHDSGNRKPSFSGLVQGVGKNDIHPRSILDELLKMGVVSVNDNDEVELQHEAFIPSKGFEEKIYFLEQNIHDHIQTATNNVIGEDKPLLERNVCYQGLTQNSVAELHEYSKDLATQVLKDINKRARELKNNDQKKIKVGSVYRFNFGAFFYKERQTNCEDSGEDKKAL